MSETTRDTALLALEHVAFAYPGRPVLFSDLSLSLSAGERLGLFGGNGEGKTTIFRLIMGLEKPKAGLILLHGTPCVTDRDIAAMRRAVGLVLQEADDQLFCPTVLEDVCFGPLNLGLAPDEARERASSVLTSLGLRGFEDRLTHRLSGGEKKLVSLAGVLAMAPQALLLDEPTAALDRQAQERLTDILANLPMARIIISHDRAFLEACSDTVLTLANGELTRA